MIIRIREVAEMPNKKAEEVSKTIKSSSKLSKNRQNIILSLVIILPSLNMMPRDTTMGNHQLKAPQ